MLTNLELIGHFFKILFTLHMTNICIGIKLSFPCCNFYISICLKYKVWLIISNLIFLVIFHSLIINLINCSFLAIERICIHFRPTWLLSAIQIELYCSSCLSSVFPCYGLNLLESICEQTGLVLSPLKLQFFLQLINLYLEQGFLLIQPS